MAFMSSQIYLIFCKLYKRIELNYPLENIVHYKIFSHLPLMWQSHLQPYSHSCSHGLKNRNGSIDGVCICRSALLQWPLDMGNKKKSHGATTDKCGGCVSMSQPVLQQSQDGMRYHFVLREEEATLQQQQLFWMEGMSHIIAQHWIIICTTDWSSRWNCMVQHKSIKGVSMKCITFRAPWFFSATLFVATLKNAFCTWTPSSES